MIIPLICLTLVTCTALMSRQRAKQSVCSLDSLLDFKCFQPFELFAVLLSTLGQVHHTAATFWQALRKFEVSWYGVAVLRFALVTGVGLHGQ